MQNGVLKNEQEVKSSSKYTTPNLQNALSLVDLISKQKNGLSLPEMIQQTGVPKSTLFRICSTLMESGYLMKDDDTGHFILTRKFLRIGLAALGEESLIEKALAPMRELRDAVNETVLLGTLMEKDVALLEQVIGNHPFTFFIKPGKHFVMHASAPGKALLAFLKEEDRETIFSKIEMIPYNERTITSREAMMKEIEDIRQKGYAVDRAEEMDGIHCVAAPVFDQHRHPLAVIWTTGPSARLTEAQFEMVGREVMECAHRISVRFGYNV